MVHLEPELMSGVETAELRIFAYVAGLEAASFAGPPRAAAGVTPGISPDMLALEAAGVFAGAVGGATAFERGAAAGQAAEALREVDTGYGVAPGSGAGSHWW